MSRFSSPTSRRAKIVATLGPGSSAPDTIHLLAQTGVDIFRLNFSHGDHEGHKRNYESVRLAQEKVGRPLGVLADMQGPKIRVGSFPEGYIRLSMNEEVKLVPGKTSDEEHVIPVPHPEILKVMEVGDQVLVDDGKIILTVTKTGDTPWVRSDLPAKIGDKKGFTLLGKALPVPALTPKDKEDLEFACSLGADFIALSFVQTRADLEEARALMKGRGRLVAKVEKPAAIKNLEDIVDGSDGIMVARGDLGVEYPPEMVPILQRRIVRASRAAGKPVIVATHMLESMVESASPTRAEASDVATAIYQGTDAIMLSSETAVGRHPATAVSIMDRIVVTVENDKEYATSSGSFAPPKSENSLDADSIADAISELAEQNDCIAVFVSTAHFSVISRFSRARFKTRLIAHNQDKTKLGHMSLFWGVEPLSSAGTMSDTDLVAAVKQQLGSEVSGKIACAFQTKGLDDNLAWRLEVIRV
ncbi:pyruvate kinase [Hirschia litorea]|uniref:Pyruvate kinase n=1 Tax=Hirschia litorea TaxID=1199156 RepID=A0ABW2IHD6_9PROT